MRILALNLALFLSLLGFQAHAASNASNTALDAFLEIPVFEPALDYTSIDRINDCSEERVREVKYHACRDSRAIYDKALANAKKVGQPLMVIFGFNRCPYCVVLEKTIFNPDNVMTGGHVARYFSETALREYIETAEPLKISVVRIHARSPHGLKLADDLGVTHMANDRGWHRVWSPFVLFVNPETGAMASESYWEAEEVYCDWPANVATSLEAIDMVKSGKPYTERERCKKN